MTRAPHYAIDMAAFWRDPYPTLETMRRDAPIAYVSELGGVMLTRRDDIIAAERDVEVFSSHQPDGLMNRLMGLNLMRKDGEAHRT
ncbi:MAG: cytochrome P450, partial [Geminicoccaceae bacterium]